MNPLQRSAPESAEHHEHCLMRAASYRQPASSCLPSCKHIYICLFFQSRSSVSAKMRLLSFVVLASTAVQGASLPRPGSRSPSLSARQTVCDGNTADDRSTWCDYDLSTDYYNEVPDTGVIREYYFEVTNSTLAPDGIERIVLSINGSVPGPTLQGNWGDTFKIHVTNSLTNNGTGIHWHGIRQNWTNQEDGVPSITQCPIAPGDSMTYTW